MKLTGAETIVFAETGWTNASDPTKAIHRLCTEEVRSECQKQGYCGLGGYPRLKSHLQRCRLLTIEIKEHS